MKSLTELLQLEGYHILTKWERWQLIDQIEQQIDVLQRRWVNQLNLGSRQIDGSDVEQTLDQIQQLRAKRFQIWNTFYPRFVNHIQLAA